MTEPDKRSALSDPACNALLDHVFGGAAFEPSRPTTVRLVATVLDQFGNELAHQDVADLSLGESETTHNIGLSVPAVGDVFKLG